jgi:hypothetical protein
MGADDRDGCPLMIVTASLTTGVARVTQGTSESLQLFNDIFGMDHAEWETILYVGDTEYHCTKHGPYPNHQLRISVRPSSGVAALNYTDHDDPQLTIANSFNSTHPPPSVHLIFNGSTGAMFPPNAAIPISDARRALREWLQTRRRPTCIEWRPFDAY